MGHTGDDLGHYDQRIIDLEVRDGTTLVIGTAMFKERGMMKFFREDEFTGREIL